MGLDPAVLAFLSAAAVANEGRPATHEGTVEQARQGYDALSGLGPGPEVHLVKDVTLPGPAGPIGARVYRPNAGTELACLVFYHGGGWTIGSLSSHDRECRELCQRAEVVVVSVDYRLAPEHPYPAAVDDSWAALVHVAANGAEFGIGADRIAVGGDSAGANLAAVMALRARDVGLDLRLQVLIYPAVDFQNTSVSLTENADAPILPLATMLWFGEHYFKGCAPELRLEPDASPILAPNHENLAPAFIATAEFDVLRDEGNTYADVLRKAGVHVEAKMWDGMPHAFMQLGPVVPAGIELIDEMASAIAAACNQRKLQM